MIRAFEDQAGPTRRAALSLIQPRRTTRIIRRVLLALTVAFAVVFLLAYFNPVLHKGSAVVACSGSAI